ncbi:MAG TPA: recombinase family protein [Thermoguttaceae bacterium]|nr:recombinase family protein [Thermoguttaceae bacterium]
MPLDDEGEITMPQIYGYARASTKEQEDSPKVQAEKIQRRADRLSEVEPDLGRLDPGEHIASENKSADKISWEDRPAFKSLMRTLERGDVLIVTHYDRLDRNPFRFVACISELDRRGIRLILLNFMDKEFDLNDTMCATVVFLFAAFLKMWSDYNRQRMRDTNRWLKSQGRAAGLVPYGMKYYKKGDGKTYHQWDEEQCLLLLELYNRLQCGESYHDVARDWHRRKLTRPFSTKQGRVPWIREKKTDRPGFACQIQPLQKGYKWAAKEIADTGMVGCVPYDPTVGVENAYLVSP